MRRFLIIDDDPAFRRLLVTILSPYGHCDVAYDGHEGTGIFRVALDARTDYDLICLDIDMPITDGHQVLAAIREIERQRGILGANGVKIIMTTSLQDSKHCLRAFCEGCESYMTKPVDKHQLLSQVRMLLGDLGEPTDSNQECNPAFEAALPSADLPG
jgi:two-component system chemotaxis response regulator CheY